MRNVLSALAGKIKYVYRNSVLHRIGSFISRAYLSSVIFSFHSGGTLDTALSSSVCIHTQKENKKITSGRILQAYFDHAERMKHMSLGVISIIAGIWMLAVGARMALDHRYAFMCPFLLMGALLLIAFSRSRVSFWNVVCGSFAGRFFDFRENGDSRPQNPITISLLGIAAILAALYLPFSLAVAVPLCCAAFMMLPGIRPVFFISLLLLWLPLGTTAHCIVLCVLAIATHFFQRLFDITPAKKTDYFDILLAVFVVLCLLGSLFSFAKGDSFRVIAMWLPLFCVCFIIYRNVRSRHDVSVVVSSLLIGALFSCAFGLWQYFSGQVDTTWTDTELFEDLSIRVYSTFANPNVFGEFLLLILPLSVGFGLYYDKIKYKIACFLMTLVAFATLALTYSRGCYVGIALTAVVFLWMYNKKIFGALALIGLPLGIAAMPQNMIDRIVSIGNFSDSSTSYRLKIYEGTLALLRQYWPSGLGIGETAFNYVYPFFGLQGIVAPHSHSLFFQLMISFGIAGLIYFLIVLFVYHRNIISLMVTISKKSKDRVILITFGSVLSGFLLQSVFDYTWYNYRVYALFWIVLTLGFCAYRIISKDGEKDQ